MHIYFQLSQYQYSFILSKHTCTFDVLQKLASLKNGFNFICTILQRGTILHCVYKKENVTETFQRFSYFILPPTLKHSMLALC